MVRDESIVVRVQRELAKAGKSDQKHKDIRHQIYDHLKAIHNVAYSDNVKDLAESKERHRNFVDAFKPDDEPAGK